MFFLYLTLYLIVGVLVISAVIVCMSVKDKMSIDQGDMITPMVLGSIFWPVMIPIFLLIFFFERWFDLLNYVSTKLRNRKM